MAITDFYTRQLPHEQQELFRVSTDPLTAIFNKDFARIQLFSVKNNPHGWVERNMIYSSTGVPLEDFSTDFIIDEISSVVNKDGDISMEKELYWREQAETIMKKAIVKLIQNEK